MRVVDLLLFLILPVKGLQKGRLVFPRLLEERSSERTMVMQVHDQLTLNLRKASVAAPTLRLITEEKGKMVTHYYNGEHVEKDLYEDTDKIASVIVTRDHFGMHVTRNQIISERQYPWSVLPQVPQVPQVPPATVYVEIFVVSDQNHHKHFTTNDAFLGYLCVMINSANLRFAATSSPLMVLLLVGAEMSQTHEYIDIYASNPNFDMYSDTASALSYGVGYIASVCTEFFVALGEDKAGLYTGTHGMTHELAHVLGAPHDGDAPPSVGHPGSQGCPWDNGNIMSYVDKGPSHHQFSTCSLLGMRHVITLAGYACWQISKTGYKLDDVFPGMVVDLQAFCKESIQEQDATIESATVMETTCKVHCLYFKLQLMRAAGYNYYQRARYYKQVNALDYTTCAENKVCIQGVCVRKPAPKQTTMPPATVATSMKPAGIPTLETSQHNCWQMRLRLYL
ncbi:hypothetical protein MTO96_002464 [Rhipicephalus appendiculatus]